MSIVELTCTNCGHHFKIKFALRPKTIQCPACKSRFETPECTDQCQDNHHQAITETNSEQKIAPGAIKSLLCALIGMLFFGGFILGIIAIKLGNEATERVFREPQKWKGFNIARTGWLLGWIDVIGWGIGIALKFGGALK